MFSVMTHRFWLSVFVTALLLAVAMPRAATAGGAASGIHIDPGSPAAKEYALPLSSARGVPPGSASSGGLFGVGITYAGARPDGRAATRSRYTASHPTPGLSQTSASVGEEHARGSTWSSSRALRLRRTGSRRPSGAGSLKLLTPPAAAETLHSSSGPGNAWMIGAAVAVLALSGIVAAIVRTLDRRPRRGLQ